MTGVMSGSIPNASGFVMSSQKLSVSYLFAAVATSGEHSVSLNTPGGTRRWSILPVITLAPNTTTCLPKSMMAITSILMKSMNRK